MAEIKTTFTLASLPGIKRDGTVLDGDHHADGQWCRFQRGKPKKMGGFMRITDKLSGPVRANLVWSRETLNAIFSFSQYGIEQLLVDQNALGSSIIDRTPAGWTKNGNALWSIATQYDDAVGSQGTAVLAHASSSLVNIDDSTATKPYLGLAADSSTFTQIADAPAVSGGVFACPPYTLVHGSDGFVGWSDANLPQNWYTDGGATYPVGDSGADRVTGAKIVKGLPLRSGSGPAGLLWSLDSVLRFDYSGGAVFKFAHLSTQSSILSQNGVIEYDGAYFWMGVDRFLVCDGGQVREVPNQMNINWVYDNLNFAQRQKVWVTKIPRYGEIWWHFPYGTAEECTHAVIYNVREQTWYDTRSSRSAGFYSQVLHYPVWSNSAKSANKAVLNLTSGSGTVSVGDLLYGTTSGATATVELINSTLHYVSLTSSAVDFLVGETVTDATSGATRIMSDQKDQYAVFAHEKGRDAVEGDTVTAIQSYYVTADFGFPTGGPQPNQPQGVNRWTRVVRVEPDFLQEGEMTMTLLGKEFANAPETPSIGYNFTADTKKIDTRYQAREVRAKFESNTVGGHYETGRPLIHLEPGDVRS